MAGFEQFVSPLAVLYLHRTSDHATSSRLIRSAFTLGWRPDAFMCRFSQLGVTHSGLDTARVGALRVWGWSAVQRTGYDPRAPPWVVGGRHPRQPHLGVCACRRRIHSSVGCSTISTLGMGRRPHGAPARPLPAQHGPRCCPDVTPGCPRYGRHHPPVRALSRDRCVTAVLAGGAQW